MFLNFWHESSDDKFTVVVAKEGGVEGLGSDFNWANRDQILAFWNFELR
jgi:hypothetical protein